MQTLTKENFASEVLQAKGTILVDMWAPWCGPCRMIAPVLEQLEGERPDIRIGKVNVDEQGELAMQYRVSSIPTLLVFKDGQLVNRSVGALPKRDIEKLLD